MIKINNVDIKIPSKFVVSIGDIDGESVRNAKGDLIKDRITTKRSLACEWKTLTQAECAAILNALTDIYFTVTYPDPMSGVVTKTCYVSDRNMPMLSNLNGAAMWDGLGLSFTEK